MQTNSGHLTYCTNIHAGESWKDHFAALQLYFPQIKSSISPKQPMGIGLRLSNQASLELENPDQLNAFKNWLDQSDAYVFTMNGFPYGGFHHTRVKDQVHAPDWTTRDRVEYTLRMFGILTELLPAGMDGGISTSPLTYRHWHATEEQKKLVTKKATENILEIISDLIRIKKQTGKILHLDIEPEPDGMLETGTEFLNWYESFLLPLGIPFIMKTFGVSEEESANLIRKHVCICYDVCHFAIGYEDHEAMVKEFIKKRIRIGKFQISAALKSEMPTEKENRIKIKEAFTHYNEPVYLHQVVARKLNATVLRYPDLNEALNDFTNIDVVEWRAHYHVPIFELNYGLLQSTNEDIKKVLALHQQLGLTQHLEVETYTWEVLSPEVRLPIEQSIIRELEWVLKQLEIH